MNWHLFFVIVSSLGLLQGIAIPAITLHLSKSMRRSDQELLGCFGLLSIPSLILGFISLATLVCLLIP